MSILTCLIIDDEKYAREGLAEYVDKIPFLSLQGLCKSALEAQAKLNQQAVDVLFLDIQMPDLSGLAWVKSIPHTPFVIFTTAYREYALEGYEVDALDFLVKPISFQRFFKACNKALEMKKLMMVEPEEKEEIFIKADGQFLKILLKDITFLEASGDYIYIHTHQKRFLALLTLKQIELDLPDAQFLRVHRSYIINRNFVNAIEGNMLLIGEHKIPISRSLHDEVYDALMKGKLWKKR